MDKLAKNQVPMLMEIRRQSISMPTSPELATRRQSLTVLQLSEDATWKEAIKRDFKTSTINLPVRGQSSRISSVLDEMSKRRLFNFRFSVGFLFICIIIMIASTSYYHQQRVTLFTLSHQIKVFQETRQFNILNQEKTIVVKINYGVNLPSDISPLVCDAKLNRSLCLHWNFRANLTIDYEKDNNQVNCHHIQWKAQSNHEILKDCIHLADGQWFGMGQTDLPKPLNGINLQSIPFVSSHHFNAGLNRRISSSSPFGSLIKRYWISSKGFTVHVPLSVPLWISFNSTTSTDKSGDNQLCLEAQTNRFPYKPNRENPPHLEYTICSGHSITAIHSKNAKNWISWKTSANDSLPSPEAFFIDKPIWYIDGKIMNELEKQSIESYINRTIDFGPLPGLLLLDTKWQRNLGDLQIDEIKFSDLKKVFTGAKRRGFKIMLTVDPLIDSSSPLFDQTISEERVFIDNRLMTPLITSCEADIMHNNNLSVKLFNQKRSFCALINLYNTTTREWFANRLANLTNYSIDGIMFKSVQVSRMPRYPLSPQTTGLNPDNYQLFVKQILESNFDLLGMDTFTGTNGISGFVKISPLESSWKSLQHIIPTVISLGLIGYPLVNSGSVGGDIISTNFVANNWSKNYPLNNSQTLATNSTNEATQLYIRWMQLATFLPILQLSQVPDDDLQQLVHHFIELREKRVIPLMKNCMNDYLSTGLPIIRPIWMLDPDVKESYLINNQFAIGNEMLIAPILSYNLISRDIYLPIGWWKDEISGSTIRGGKWMRNYQLELSRIAFFTRIKQEV